MAILMDAVYLQDFMLFISIFKKEADTETSKVWWVVKFLQIKRNEDKLGSSTGEFFKCLQHCEDEEVRNLKNTDG